MSQIQMSNRSEQCARDEAGPLKLLTTEEAASFLRVSRRTMEDWRRTGSGPHFFALARNCVRYEFDDLLQWIRQRRVSHTLAR